MKTISHKLAACLGADTRSVRTTEYMEECRLCGTEVQYQFVDHPFFGFKSGCDRFTKEIKSTEARRAG